MRRATKKNTAKEWPGTSSNGNQGSVQENESKDGVRRRRSQPDNKMDRRMAPTELMSEAPTDGEERFLGRTGGERTVSQSHCHFGYFQSCCPWQACVSSDTGRSRSVIRQESIMLSLTFSKHRLGRCTEKAAVGQGNRTTVRKTGRWGGGLGKTGDAFWFWWHCDYCCVTGDYQQRTLRTTTVFFRLVIFFRWQREECLRTYLGGVI